MLHALALTFMSPAQHIMGLSLKPDLPHAHTLNNLQLQTSLSGSRQSAQEEKRRRRKKEGEEKEKKKGGRRKSTNRGRKKKKKKHLKVILHSFSLLFISPE